VASTTGLTATSQGADAGAINIAWTYEFGDDCISVQVQYKTSTWHNWGDAVSPGTYYKNNFSANEDYTYEFRLYIQYKISTYVSTYYTSSAVSCTVWTDSNAEAITLTDDGGEDVSFHGSHAETITLTDSGASAQALSDSHHETIHLADAGAPVTSLTSDYQYYFGSFDGQVYTENKDYLSDDGNSIHTFLNLKQGDFADQDPSCLDQYKTVYGGRLWYVDVHAGATTTLQLSVDGGSTWTYITVNLGNGDGTTKSVDFHVILSGHTITPRLVNDSPDQDFQWIALQIYYKLSGEYF